MSLLIRDETEADWPTVYKLNMSAFETDAEAKLVNILRAKTSPIISLVAEENNNITGHILFTPVTLSDNHGLKLMGLAPMAVLPEYQNRAIGSALVREGLERCRQLGYGAVVVLGHPKYYPRFGFVPSANYGIDVEYDVPEEVFMIVELQTHFLKGKTGKIKYHKAFSEL